MSNFERAAYHPQEKRIRTAIFLDDYFGRHRYGVKFDGDDRVYNSQEVEIPLGVVFAPVLTNNAEGS